MKGYELYRTLKDIQTKDTNPARETIDEYKKGETTGKDKIEIKFT
jgi:hypothetical protein